MGKVEPFTISQQWPTMDDLHFNEEDEQDYDITPGYIIRTDKCQICNKKYARIKGDPSHYDFGYCSIDCWILNENFGDEIRTLYISGEQIEVAEVIANQWIEFLDTIPKKDK